MSYLRIFVLSFGILFLVGINNALSAGSGGLRNETPDAGAFGKGSAFVGEANTPSAIFYNPAGMNQIKSTQISMGGAIIAPAINYKSNSGDKVQARRDNFFVPHVYVVAPINDKLSLGLGAGSYWGLGTEWAADSFSRYVSTKAELENKDIMLAASYQVTDQWSVAASADNDDSKASLSKKLNNLAPPDANAQLKAKSNAWGFRLATMFKINDQNQVGLMYRSPIHHKFVGKVYLDSLSAGVYGPGGALGSNFNSSYETRITEKIVLPQSIVMGYSFKPNNKWTFNFDLEWFNWSHLKQELISYPDETNAGNLSVLNLNNPAQRKWHSTFSEAIGGEYKYSDTLRLRAGYYHHTHVIPQGTVDSSNPDSNSHGMTVGFGYDLSQHLTLDMAFSTIIYETREVQNNVGQAASLDAAKNINGKYSQITNVGMATVTYKF